MVETARNSERSSGNSRSRSTHRRIFNPPVQKDSTGCKRPAPEPVVTEMPATKEKITAKKKPVGSKKRKQAASKEDSGESSLEPVGRDSRKRRSPQGDPHKGLTIINTIAKKNKNTDVKKDTKLQIRYRPNKSLLYNATVTKVLNDERVKVCTKDDDEKIAKIQFKIVRLTGEQAKSGKPSVFTKGCANVGFAVAGAHDS